MILCAAGDIHGELDRMYSGVFAFEAALGVRFAWILHVGDFGVWPHPARVDGATKRHDGAGDFPTWFAERRAAPRPSVFIKGNHEDFVWLDSRPDFEVLPGLHYLRNGHVRELVVGAEVLRVGGIGGCFGPSNFERRSSTLQGYAKRHYTRDEIETLSAHENLDVVLTHDAPAGVRFIRHRRGEGYASEAAGLDELLATTQPRVCFFGHHHTRLDAEVAGVPCLGLNKGPYPGCLVAIEVKPAERGFRVLGEWPPKLAARLAKEGPLRRAARGLYYAPRPSKWGPVPPREEELVRGYLKGGRFMFTGSPYWNDLRLGPTGVLAVGVVYNTQIAGMRTIGNLRFLFKRKRFPDRPTAEWYIVDLFENCGMIGAAHSEVVEGLVRSLRRGKWNVGELRRMAAEYGTRTTRASIEECIEAAKVPAEPLS